MPKNTSGWRGEPFRSNASCRPARPRTSDYGGWTDYLAAGMPRLIDVRRSMGATEKAITPFAWAGSQILTIGGGCGSGR